MITITTIVGKGKRVVAWRSITEACIGKVELTKIAGEMVG